MSGSSNDVPRGRGAVRPPPSSAPGDEPAVEVPRMEPPPPSLEAMVQSTTRSPVESGFSRFWLIAIVVIGVAITAYVMR